ncbi:MAG: hypothetical protein GY919_08215 [Photobacterium aquimaris]|nr:hypothetical protein [Photobacterium aquimaris]
MKKPPEYYTIEQPLNIQKGLFNKIALMMGGVLICVMLTALTLSYYSNTQRLVKNVNVMMNALAPVFIDTIVFQDTESSLEFNRLISQYKEIRSLSVYDFDNNCFIIITPIMFKMQHYDHFCIFLAYLGISGTIYLVIRLILMAILFSNMLFIIVLATF